MSQTNFTPILLYASNTATSVPSAGNLTNSANGAELAINTADKRLFTKDGGGSVVELGTNPSSLSLPNQTANGVLYLNGSKVATSGSALTFDGASLRLANAVGTTANGLRLDGGAQAHYWYLSDNVTSAYEIGSGSGQWKWLNSNGEQMRLTGTGLGIGTSSPGYKLDVNGTGRVTTEVRVKNTAGNVSYLTFEENGNGNSATFISGDARTTGNMGFWTNSTERMRLDSSGNLGIGTSSPATKLDVRGTTGVGIRWLETSSGNSTRVQLGTASGLGYIDADAGTGSIALGFRVGGADLMRLDSSGNLGLGVTPTTRLDVSMTGGMARFGGASGNNMIQAYSSGGTLGLWAGGSSQIYSNSSLIFTVGATTGTGAPTGGTQAMTLDASGNLLVGQTSGSDAIEVTRSGSTSTGLVLNQTGTSGRKYIISSTGTGYGSAGNLIFYDATAAAERARITSGGDLYVGQLGAQASEQFGVTTTGAKQAAAFRNDDNSKDNIVSWVTTTSGNAQFVGFYTEASPTQRGSITYNRAGGLVSYNTTSDYRAKDILGPVQNVGATIDALKVYEGVMKGATQSRPMLIAHEAQAHAPYAVSGVKDEVNEDGTPKFQQMDVSSLVPLLLAEIQSLRARVAALEGV